jgi:hypothetical protein
MGGWITVSAQSIVARRINIRDEKCGGSGASLLDSVGDVLEDGEVEMRATGLLGVGSTNNLGA